MTFSQSSDSEPDGSPKKHRRPGSIRHKESPSKKHRTPHPVKVQKPQFLNDSEDSETADLPENISNVNAVDGD